MLESDGHIVCDDSNGYYIILGEVSLAKDWDLTQVINGAVYRHVRSAFQAQTAPWKGICETCDLFSATGMPRDTIATKLSVMVEPTLHCRLGCPTCKRVQEGRRRSGSWDLDPKTFERLLESCAANNIEVDNIHYLGWGEPLLHRQFAELTHIARRLAPIAVQEVTTTGNVDLHEGLRDLDIDKLVISCDGVDQDAYAKFRRNGSLKTVFDFMSRAPVFFKRKPFIEWKYILFDHNDSDAEIALAQSMADEANVDSLLFIVTNSKGASRRFALDTIGSFPKTSLRTSLSPAAALMKVRFTAVIDVTNLGDKPDASLYIDKCVVTESDMLVMEGWCLDASGGYVTGIELIAGGQLISRTRTLHKRFDVVEARPQAAGPDCGFMFRFPVSNVHDFDSVELAVDTTAGRATFNVGLRFEQSEMLQTT